MLVQPSGDERRLDLRRADGWPSLCCGLPASVSPRGSGALRMSSDVFRTEHDLSDNFPDFDSRWADLTRDESEPDPGAFFHLQFAQPKVGPE